MKRQKAGGQRSGSRQNADVSMAHKVNPLTSVLRRGIICSQYAVGRLCMKGGVYTKEKCPICGQGFSNTGKDLICSTHLTRPAKVYIKLYSKELHKHLPIYTDPVTREAFRSYQEADQLLSKIRVEIKQGGFDPSRYVAQKLKPLRFSNWSKAWIDRLKLQTEQGKKSPSYFKAVRVYVRKYQGFFGEMDIRDISTKKIDELSLTLTGAPHYVKNILDCLKTMLSDALEWGDIQQLPKFPKIEVPEPDTKIIDLDQQDAIINAISNRMDRAFILFTAREMLRPSETRALQWDDIDLKHDRVIIRRHFSLNQIRPATKAKQIKRLPLDGEVKQVLLSLPRHITSPFVFYKGKQGRPFSESWGRRLFKRVATKMGIEISFYQGTRHSSATEATNRVGVDAVQEFLHHTSRRMTERYVKENPDRMKKVLREK